MPLFSYFGIMTENNERCTGPMLKYPCLVLDHDDTVVQTEKTIGYPYFRYIIEKFRPGVEVTLRQFVNDCHRLGFAEMCRQLYQFTPEELQEEHEGWRGYVMSHVPDVFPGIERIIRRQKEAGGLVCVVSHSAVENITRDYRVHFGMQPDAIYGWDYPEEQRKPSPYPLLDIMERYNLSPKDLLVVDDTKLACQMAESAGVEIAFAAWSKDDFPKLAAEMRSLCHYSFDTVEDFEKFLFA